MKICCILLAFCAIYPISAFVVQTPKAQSVKGSALAQSSYLEGLGGEDRKPGSDLVTNYSNASPEPKIGSPDKGDMAVASSEAYTKKLEQRLAALEQSGPPPMGAPGKESWDSAPILVQGGTLKTWSFASAALDSVQVKLQTQGRPLDADVELWQGPDNTPHKIRVYLENGNVRPFTAKMMTPRGPNTIAIRNIGELEFPLAAFVVADVTGNDGPLAINMPPNSRPQTVQGGALKTFAFQSNVESVQILLQTDGRPLNSRIELLQGPNNIKQVVEVYTEDGMDRPFFIVIECPGSGNVVRIVNSSTVEFPLTAMVEPYTIGRDVGITEPVIGGDNDRSGKGMMDFSQW